MRRYRKNERERLEGYSLGRADFRGR